MSKSGFLNSLSEIFNAEEIATIEAEGAIGGLEGLLVTIATVGEEKKATRAIAGIHAIIRKALGEVSDEKFDNTDQVMNALRGGSVGTMGPESKFDANGNGYDIGPDGLPVYNGMRETPSPETKTRETKTPETRTPPTQEAEAEATQLIDDYTKNPKKDTSLLNGLLDALQIYGEALADDQLYGLAIRIRVAGGALMRGFGNDVIREGLRGVTVVEDVEDVEDDDDPVIVPVVPPPPTGVVDKKDDKNDDDRPGKKNDEDEKKKDEKKKDEVTAVDDIYPALTGLLRPEFLVGGAKDVKESKNATLADKYAFEVFDKDLRTNPNESTKEFKNPIFDSLELENKLRFGKVVRPTRPKLPPAKNRFRKNRIYKTFTQNDQSPSLNEPFRFLPS
jgi:hypothetical protein